MTTRLSAAAVRLHSATTHARHHIRQRLARVRSDERGVTTLEYVVIAGVLFVAAVGLAGWLATVIATRQNAIQP